LAGLAVTGPSVEDERWNFGSRDAFAVWRQSTFGAWTEGWPLEPKDEFIRAEENYSTKGARAFHAARGWSARLNRQEGAPKVGVYPYVRSRIREG
jgi:hypothetical protein